MHQAVELSMRYALPRIRDIFFLAVFASAILLGPRMLNIDSDLGRHLTLGQYILNQHRIPLTDILSHTKNGEPRPAYEWLSQILLALANRALGLDGVILLSSFVIGVAFAFAYSDAVRRSGLPIAAFILALLAVGAGSIHWLPRPHIFTFLLLVIWLDRLERFRIGESIPIWQFPLIMLIWANLHGGFIFGLFAWVAYIVGWAIDRWLKRESANSKIGKGYVLVGILSLFASVVTPSGWGNWKAVLGNSSFYILSRTVETMPPDFHQREFWPFLILLLLCIAIPALSEVRLPYSHIFLLIGFTLLSLMMVRNIPLFALAATPILASSARTVLDRFGRWFMIETRLLEIERMVRGLIWPIVGTLAIGIPFAYHFIQTKESLTKYDPREFPVSAANWLVENPQSGRMFNEFNWGGYLLYRLWPNQFVFLDSQTDFYGEELVREYEGILSAGGDWREGLAKYDVDWVIIRPSSGLAQILMQSKEWEVLYKDDIAIVCRRVR